jgi:anti-sigma regulatory factor (Ser/Thr protein kinase)
MPLPPPKKAERRLVLETKLPELARLAAFARDAGREEGLGADQIFALELCLEEAAANIITHGSSGQGNIWVSITRAPAHLVARLEDDGLPFDPTAAPPPAAPQSLEHARPGGLGIHLIRKFTTNLLYERVNERNRLTLEFACAEVA